MPYETNSGYYVLQVAVYDFPHWVIIFFYESYPVALKLFNFQILLTLNSKVITLMEIGGIV
jgi:hypothetical protein